VIDVHFVILGAFIGVAGMALYVRDTIRGETQPNRVTWLLWGVAPLIIFAVEIREGVGLRALITGMAAATALTIFLASFVNRRAVWRIGPFDWACGVLSVAGTIGWLLTRDGIVALVAALVADLLAGLPTVVKSFREPDTESPALYRCSLVNAVITLLTVNHVTLAVVAFPAYIAGMSGMQTLLVSRRRQERVRA